MSYGELDPDGFIQKKWLPDGRLLAIDPYGTGYRLGIGPYPPLELGQWFEDIWIYQGGNRVFEVFETWNPVTDPEPPGWYRHPATARRRTNGDPEKEYILP